MLKFIFSMILSVAIASSAELKPHKAALLSQDGKVLVSFKAYKTPSKTAIGGQFENVKFIPLAQSGNNLREIFVGSRFVIDSKSAVIKTKEHDNKLMKYIFESFNIDNIGAKIVDMKSDTMVKGKPNTGTFFVDIDMNGVVKNIPMRYSFEKGELSAAGIVDVSTFNSNLIYMLLNQALEGQHEEGVSRSVAIGFNTKIKSEPYYAKNSFK